MDKETRESVMGTILTYARTADDWCLLELVGWTPCSAKANTVEQRQAVISAVVPLLSDDLLDDLIHHIAEVLVRRCETTEVAA